MSHVLHDFCSESVVKRIVEKPRMENGAVEREVGTLGSVLMHLLESAIVGTVVAVIISYAAVQRLDHIIESNVAQDRDQEARLRALEATVNTNTAKLTVVQQQLVDLTQHQMRLMEELHEHDKVDRSSNKR